MSDPSDRPRGSSSPADGPPEYTLYRSRRGLFRRDSGDVSPGSVRSERRSGPRLPRRPRRVGWRRVLGYLALASLAWIALSLVLFLVSAQIQQSGISDAADASLGGAGYILTSPNNVLVLGSDARTADTREPGATPGSPSRSDTMLLMRVGGGANSRLGIPRDTVVDIPGHGRNKINAAYAIGGAALAVQTVEAYLGIDIHHLVEVNFDNFPDFIDALGGIDIRTNCVVSRINGGFSNGGFTLRLSRGEHHLDGDQALALARTRTNECNRNENDLTRARRQQKILAAIRSQILSPSTFLRLPLVSWQAPKAVRSDMSGPSLLGLFGAIASGGTARTALLKPTGFTRLPDGGSGLEVSDAERQAEVARFLDG